MTSNATWAFVLVAFAVFAGCRSTSGGGSQTNWINCKKDGDCPAGSCVRGSCAPSTRTNDSGNDGATARGEKDSGAHGATAMSDSGELGPWSPTTGFPDALPKACVAGADYAYCRAGSSTSIHYSRLSATGLASSWTPTTDYPLPTAGTSCVVGSGYIYCMGGYLEGQDGAAPGPTADVYFAPLSAPGIGTWGASTPLPAPWSNPKCMESAGYVYCIGSVISDVTPEAYFAPISSSGVGAWTRTEAPPTFTQGCSAIGGYAYCFGAGNCPPRGPQGDCYSPSYFAPLGANGIGTWKVTTELPTAVSASYVTAGSYIYYLSIPVFFANVSQDGIAAWKTTTNYPDALYGDGCISNSGYLYCAGPGANAAYFAQIGARNPQALQLRNPPPFPRSDYLVPAWNHGDGCMVSANGVTAGEPCFSNDIDGAFIFDCASRARTPAGCKTTVVSSDVTYNYDVTVWYPCPNDAGADTNCCFLPSVGYDTPINDWCVSTGSNAFIIASKINLVKSQ